jgi:hypothetical protein
MTTANPDAAPEMLRALRLAIVYLNTVHLRPSASFAEQKALDETKRTIRAAIAKAEEVKS